LRGLPRGFGGSHDTKRFRLPIRLTAPLLILDFLARAFQVLVLNWSTKHAREGGIPLTTYRRLNLEDYIED
jgi:hypothetical protein